MKCLSLRVIISAVVSLVFALNVAAKTKPVTESTVTISEPEISLEAQYILADTLRYSAQFDSIAFLTDFDQEHYTVSPYLIPLTFYGKVSPSDFKVSPSVDTLSSYNGFNYIIEPILQAIQRDSLRQSVITTYMAQNPESIEYDWFNMAEPPNDTRLLASLEGVSFDVEVKTFADDVLNMGIPKADRWKHKVNSSIQFSQNYVSDNWYQGGESNINILSLQAYELQHFDETGKHEFSARFDLKTGFYTTQSDTVRSLRVNDNLFQVTSKYGIRAMKRWYYTGSLLFKTQVFNSYAPNTENLQSQFLSPAEVNFSLGMDYKYENPKKTVNWSLLLAPVAYNLDYVANIKDIDETAFGIKEGKHALHQVGSSLMNNLVWKIAKNIEWNSRIFLFTNYDNSQLDFENVFNFTVNKYFSARFMFHYRYDDEASGDDPWQLKELLSFGFNYTW